MAKTIMSADKAIQRADVRFYEKVLADHYTEITVRSVDVKAFGAGITTEDELLNSLVVNSGVGTETSTSSAQSLVSTTPHPEAITEADGAKKEERLKLAARIQSLKSKGVGVKPFLTQLAAVDELAKSGQSIPLMEKMEQLEDSVADQEKVLAERTRAASPRPSQPVKPALVQPQPASTRISSLLSGGAAGNSPYLRLFESMAHGIQEKLGIDPELIPENGPYVKERYNLALMIKLKREKGLAGAGIMPMWAECQELAKSNQDSLVAFKMQSIAQALRLPDPMRHQEWYQAQMEAYRQQLHAKHEHDRNEQR